MALFGCVALFSMIRVVQTLIAPFRVTIYLTQPLKIQLVLNAFEDFVNGLFKCQINSFDASTRVLNKGPQLPHSLLLKPMGAILVTIL